MRSDLKKALVLILCMMFVLTFFGCAKPASKPSAGIANPWQTFETLAEAEAAAGFKLGMPETVGSYKVSAYRVMNGEKPLFEVIYTDGDQKIDARKSQGEGQSISGVYGLGSAETAEIKGVSVKTSRASDKSETPNAVLTEFDFDGCSWSVYAPGGWSDETRAAFLSAILGS